MFDHSLHKLQSHCTTVDLSSVNSDDLQADSRSLHTLRIRDVIPDAPGKWIVQLLDHLVNSSLHLLELAASCSTDDLRQLEPLWKNLDLVLTGGGFTSLESVTIFAAPPEPWSTSHDLIPISQCLPLLAERGILKPLVEDG